MNIAKRDVIKSIIFSLLTCGMYQIYWTFCIVKESLMFTNKRGNIAFEIIASVFLPFIGLFLVERKFSEGCASQGIEHRDSSVVYLVLSLLFLNIGACLSLALMQNELNKIITVIE